MSISNQVEQYLISRQRDYLLTFDKENMSVNKVLEDLARFCRGGEESTFHPDPRVHALLEGRREVYSRIMKHINLKTQDFLDLYKKRGINYDDSSST